MKPENCKVGMKVERFWENHNNVRKNSIYTVKALRGEDVKLEETNDEYWYDLNLFRPVSKNPKPANKFEVGDEVIWHNYKVKIWGIRYDDEVNMYEYAIEDNKDNCGRTIVFEGELSPLKKPDELEVGDKFRNKFYEFRIIFVAYDDFYNKKKYICKINDTGSKGLIQTMFPEDIKEIIYE
jgi:hypothetical protein